MADLFQKYRNKALRLLKYRPRSVWEIENRLSQDGAEQEVIDVIIKQLLKHQLLDDQAFAQWLVESRTRYKPRGSLLIKRELQSFRVDRETIDQVLHQIDEAEQLSTAKHILNKNEYKWTKSSTYVAKQKAHRYLYSRGYSRSVIAKAIDDWQLDQ